MKKLISALGVILLFAGCSKEATAPTTPTPPAKIIPDCEKYHTGTLKVENRSKRNLDYDIILDNVNYGRLKVGESRNFTVLAGAHTLDYKYSDHSGYACSGAKPQIIECYSYTFWCEE